MAVGIATCVSQAHSVTKTELAAFNVRKAVIVELALISARAAKLQNSTTRVEKTLANFAAIIRSHHQTSLAASARLDL